jgi:hypothetical protein
MTNHIADSISWVATIATIIAASMTAANLGSRITGYGFAVFLIGSLAWLATGIITDQLALMWTNVVLMLLDIFGIWRWLGRQARVEEGARSASEASAEPSNSSVRARRSNVGEPLPDDPGVPDGKRVSMSTAASVRGGVEPGWACLGGPITTAALTFSSTRDSISA